MSLSPMAAAREEASLLTSPNSRDALQMGTYTPLLIEDDPLADARAFLPKPSFPTNPSSGRDSGIFDQAADSPTASRFLLSKAEAVQVDAPVQHRPRRRPFLVLIVIIVLLVVIVAIMVPVYLTVIKPKTAATTTGSHSASGPQPSGSSGSPGTKSAVFGGDGSTVTATNGTTFTYNNKLGGICKFEFLDFQSIIFSQTCKGYYDPEDPYNNNAYPNSWTPPLNTSWNWNTDRIFGYDVLSVFRIF